MFIQIRDINTGKILERRAGMIAERQIIFNATKEHCLKAARSLFNCTSHNKDFVYWVAVQNGVAVYKGQI